LKKFATIQFSKIINLSAIRVEIESHTHVYNSDGNRHTRFKVGFNGTVGPDK